MTQVAEDGAVLPVKDAEAERPIPSVWRPVIQKIVSAFVSHDYLLASPIPGVAPVSPETAAHIKDYIQDYGATLVELPEETWNSSVCIWMGTRWDVLVDLWTVEEGESDLVLSLHVTEVDQAFLLHVYMVYVP